MYSSSECCYSGASWAVQSHNKHADRVRFYLPLMHTKMEKRRHKRRDAKYTSSLMEEFSYMTRSIQGEREPCKVVIPVGCIRFYGIPWLWIEPVTIFVGAKRELRCATLEMVWYKTITSLLIAGRVRLCPITLRPQNPRKHVEESIQWRFEGTVPEFSCRNC
jgi:hypothetical protein